MPWSLFNQPKSLILDCSPPRQLKTIFSRKFYNALASLLFSSKSNVIVWRRGWEVQAGAYSPLMSHSAWRGTILCNTFGLTQIGALEKRKWACAVQPLLHFLLGTGCPKEAHLLLYSSKSENSQANISGGYIYPNTRLESPNIKFNHKGVSLVFICLILLLYFSGHSETRVG